MDRSSFIPLARFEQRYLISPEGIILNLANNSLLQPTENPNGYLKVGLANGDGTQTQQLLHILVAKHFIPNPYDWPTVNHDDGNKHNCRKENLYWATHQEQVDHALRTGLRPGYMSADDKEQYLAEVLSGTQVSVIAIRLGRRPETLHKMLRDTAKRLGIHDQWEAKMRENRKRVAIRNLEAFDFRHPKRKQS